MPTLQYLRDQFDYGYDSGSILSPIPNRTRAGEELKIGGSYREAFHVLRGFLQPDSRVLEIGPGHGSWTRAILRTVPRGEVQTVDFQDVRPWLGPETYSGRLTCHQVRDNSFSPIPDGYFDVFWAFGVLCHNNTTDIRTILTNVHRKMRGRGIALCHYGDWKKLDHHGWERARIPEMFKELPDDDIFWPRNDQATMTRLAHEGRMDRVGPRSRPVHARWPHGPASDIRRRTGASPQTDPSPHGLTCQTALTRGVLGRPVTRGHDAAALTTVRAVIDSLAVAPRAASPYACRAAGPRQSTRFAAAGQRFASLLLRRLDR